MDEGCIDANAAVDRPDNSIRRRIRFIHKLFIIARELRHSFFSLMSDAGVPVEQIARLVGQSGLTTTEAVYGKQIRPVLIEGADTMDPYLPGRRLADSQA